MQNMLERITAAEQQADQMLEQAGTQARELIARTKAEAETAVTDAQAEERSKTAAALAAAERQGEQEAAGILAEVRSEIESVRTAAQKKLPDAVSYLMERIETTL